MLFKRRTPDREHVSGNKTFILNEHRVHRAVFFFFYYYCLLCFIFFLARKKSKIRLVAFLGGGSAGMEKVLSP